MSTQLTLYGHKVSPFSERIELALREGNIPHKYYAVNLSDKPTFFAAEVNPVGKVPAITYGGPEVPPEEPSPLSTKLAESNVILEFLADAYPSANLMPADPIQRSKVRFFIEAVSARFFTAYSPWVRNTDSQAEENLLKAIEFIQDLLPESAKFAVGDNYTIADACITPFIHRLLLNIEADIGKFPVGTGPRVGGLLNTPKYAKFMAYVRAMVDRPIAKEVFDVDIVKPVYMKVFGRS